MPGQKARIKLIAALNYSKDLEFIKSFFEDGLYV